MMENLQTRVVTGIMIIAAGVLVLLNTAQQESSLVNWLWIIVLAASALAYGYIYARSRDTAAALGSYISGALALILLLITQLSVAGTIIPILVMAIIGAPFLYGGLRSAEDRGLLIPAYVMFAIALLLLITDNGAFSQYIPSYVLAVIGLPFVVAALISRTWALFIPGGIMFALALFLFTGFSGISAQLLTIVVPLLLILVGALILLRPDRDMRKAKHL